MILEAIVTTVSRGGKLNIAPMGPHLTGPLEEGFLLKPFETSTTCANLRETGCGVLHITDDALLLAQAAIGAVEPTPQTFPAKTIRGQVLAGACRWLEFEAGPIESTGQRPAIPCRVVYTGQLRPHFGFNRGKHAVLEAAILATRVHLIPPEEILAEYEKFEVIVGKAGGDDELRAMRLLRSYVQQAQSF